ncbi:MAG: hypothetical protein PHY31_02475, partial [Smithellaceae bacterium]|nr:hypothetical protein [Smithellaceae bacterium]
LIMTKDFIASSRDSYPIEFFNMQQRHVVVFGEDVLADLSFDRSFVRLQLERELKAKTILLRGGFLETEGNPKRLRRLISISITAILSLFSALLFLKEKNVPQRREELIDAVAEIFPIRADVFQKCLAVKGESDNLSSAAVAGLFREYLSEVEALSQQVDRMEM